MHTDIFVRIDIFLAFFATYSTRSVICEHTYIFTGIYMSFSECLSRRSFTSTEGDKINDSCDYTHSNVIVSTLNHCFLFFLLFYNK